MIDVDEETHTFTIKASLSSCIGAWIAFSSWSKSFQLDRDGLYSLHCSIVVPVLGKVFIVKTLVGLYTVQFL